MPVFNTAAQARPKTGVDTGLKLLFSRRFLPYFLTQFFGVVSTNLLLAGVITRLLFNPQASSGMDPAVQASLVLILFMAPFALFSAAAGKLADRYNKAQWIQRLKFLELLICLLAAWALYRNSTAILFFSLLALGWQATLFGPVKYSILAKLLDEREFISGNGLVETGTVLGLLAGQIGGFMLASGGAASTSYLAVLIVASAVLGIIASRFISTTSAARPRVRLSWNPVYESWRVIRYVSRVPNLLLILLGVSWFWAYCATLAIQIPIYVGSELLAEPSLAVLLLSLFAGGIAAGSLITQLLASKHVEIGLCPLGALGMFLFALDLSFFTWPDAATGGSLSSWWQADWSSRMLFDIVMCGVSAGLYVVPLYAWVQKNAPSNYLARVFAANNVLNALFIVLFVGLAAGLSLLELSINARLAVLAVVSAVVTVCLFRLVPIFFIRFVVFLLMHVFYRLRSQGAEQVPEQGAAVLVCNHVSFVDPLVIGSCITRPPRFVMDYGIFKIPVVNSFFRTVRTIPIAPAKKHPEILEAAYEKIHEALQNDELVVIYPEGMITWTGDMNEFKPGIERIITRDPVPVIPMALRGLWGSWFSRKGGAAFKGLPRGFWSKIELNIGQAIPPEQVSAALLQEKVAALRGDWK